MATQKKEWNYSFELPATDYRSYPRLVAPGTCVDIVGADHRFTGGLRKFSGFNEQYDLDTLLPSDWEDAGTIDFFKYAEMQKDYTGEMYKGFVVRKNSKVKFFYYDVTAAGWDAFELDAASSGTIDITYGGKFLYYAKEGTRGKTLFYWDADTKNVLTLVDFGHDGGPEDMDTDDQAMARLTAASGNTSSQPLPVPYLVEKVAGNSPDRYTARHGVAVQFVDSLRQVYSPILYGDIDVECIISGAGLRFYHFWFNFNVPAACTNTYDTLRIYRTVNYGGELYLCYDHHVPTDRATEIEWHRLMAYIGDDSLTTTQLGSGGGRIFVGTPVTGDMDEAGVYTSGTNASAVSDQFAYPGLTDGGLILQETLDPIRDQVGEVPKGGQIIHAAGVTLKTVDGSEGAFGDQRRADLVYFSRLDKYQPSTFPALNFYSLPRVSDRIRSFTQAGDYIFGVASNRLFRFAKVGAQMAIEKFNHGFGLHDPLAVAELGTSFAFIGDNHLILVDGATGSMVPVSALDRFFTSNGIKFAHSTDSTRWHLVYDSAMQCLFIFNPNDDYEAALVIWGATNTIGRILDMNFDAATSGPAPTTLVGGGNEDVDRAWFITNEGKLFTPDSERWNGRIGAGVNDPKLTTRGIKGTVQGTADQDDTTTITYAAGNFGLGVANALVDCYVYIHSTHADYGYLDKRRITASTATTLTLDSALAHKAGDSFDISPVPFGAAGWPLGQDDDPRTPRDTFRRRKVKGVGLNGNYCGNQTENEYGEIYVGCLTDITNRDGHIGLANTLYNDAVADNPPLEWIDIYQKRPHNFRYMQKASDEVYPYFWSVSSNCEMEVTGMKVLGVIEDTSTLKTDTGSGPS
jgi:hypothetical protein